MIEQRAKFDPGTGRPDHLYRADARGSPRRNTMSFHGFHRTHTSRAFTRATEIILRRDRIPTAALLSSIRIVETTLPKVPATVETGSAPDRAC